jgi:transposase
VRRAPEVRLLRGERARLGALAGAAATSPRLAQRARIVLRAADGESDRDIATALATDPGTVARWRRRFLMQRLPGIARDAPRPGRPPSISTATIQVILRSTLGRRPPGGGFWSARTLARAVGVSKTTVQRVWKAHGIEPRRAAETFRPNPGMGFVDKVTDFVGLYLDPPERAMAFAVDERARGSGLGTQERRAITAYEDRRRGLEFRAFL